MAPEGIGFKSLSGGMQSLLALLGIIGIIVPFVIGFVNFDSRIDKGEKDHAALSGQMEKWRERADIKVEELEDDVHSLQLIDKELEMKYAEIIRMMNEFKEGQKITNLKLDNLTRAE